MKKGETRKYPRIRSENIIAVSRLDEHGKNETMTTSKVVGLGGLMFENRKKLKLGERLELSMLAGLELFKVKVKVVWTSKTGEGMWQTGVEFLDISDEEQDKLLDLLMRRVCLEEEMDDMKGPDS